MNVPRLLISAASSGSGKTLMTCGILQALMNRGMKVSSFKCGPDYIDPMFHSKVIGTVSRNVDAFFSDDDTLRSLFCDVAKDTDISVIEGVMGFYDGANVEDSSASSCDVSLKLGAPAILLIDSRGAARSVLATLKGFLEFEENLVKGVIFNRMSERTFVKLKDQVEAMGVVPLGYLPKVDLDLSSRHLGLVLPDEVEDLRGRLDALARSMESSIDFDAMIEIARSAEDLPYSGLTYPKVTDI
ncbi:MAG: cobyrinic acid a,c-diamide synthase, partial [Candidatus Methanomethylophilaceae archaeon]|nr:cobyrinic acid a,c-diamide synthase [Candidatus Methanomethylophilaceae archaeon]